MKQFSSLEIMVVWLLLLVATACSGSWSGNFKDTIVVDAHIFQQEVGIMLLPEQVATARTSAFP